MTNRPDARITAASAIVVAAAFVVVTAGAARAPAPPEGRAATLGEATFVATVVAGEEPAWRAKSEQSFPGDDWSQRDDFHARETAKVHELAASQKLPVEQVLRAVDEDVRATARRTDALSARLGRELHVDPRGARAVPCKPRPFYD